jgi:eukaryotic-like serine/threonine-protein kinase
MIERLRQALAPQYSVERELGRGGMATVYLATDVKHQRAVAVKVLNPELASVLGPERFLREIEVAAGLDHPHILPLYDSGEADGLLYYVMPYVAGGSLRDRLQREKQLPVDEALQLAREVADALSYAHGHDIVHRDIKPENIMLAGGHARVADFGIARAVNAAGAERLTQTGVTVGTPVYMSPEQAAGGSDIDGRSDLYSLGCVLYEMLAGDPPFRGTGHDILRQHLVAEPRPITSIRPAVPAQAAAAIMRALAKTPADRFNPAGQFADALRLPAAAPSQPAGRFAHTATDPARATTAFALSSALVLAVIWLLVQQAGLPIWVFWSGVGLVVAGLPVIVATAIAERARATAASGAAGASGAGPSGASASGAAGGWPTWRMALLGGALAFGALGVVTTGWVASRALGIGPAASLTSSGTIGERERVILADFEDRTAESGHIATTATELMRVGLSRSQAVSIVDPAQVNRILDMMRRDPAAGLSSQVALEAAARDGIKAVITGEVAQVGSRLSVTARLVSVNGDVLAAETETAASENELTVAIDRLSGRLRQRFGESLRHIRAGAPLDRVTTGSIRALRTFSQGLQALNQGDNARAMQLIEEALAEDTTFAMAYRKLAIILSNQSERRARAVWAAQKAYEHRDRLTDRERYLVTAAYHSVVTGNVDQQISAYRTVLDLHPDDTYALNNLGVIYGRLRDYPRAAEYYLDALAVDSTNRLHYSNLASNLASQTRFDSADVIAARFANRFPDNPEVKLTFLINRAMRQDYDSAAVLVEGLLADQRGTVFWEGIAYEWWGHLDALRGQMTSAQRRWAEAFRRTEARGLEDTYLTRAARRSMVERFLLDDPQRGHRLLDEALARYPLDQLDPLNRPYGHLAMAYAAAGDTEKARALVLAYERTPDTDHSRNAQAWVTGAHGAIALAEGRVEDAIAAFRQFDEGNDCATCGSPWLGRAYDMAGQTDSAVASFTRFVDQPSAALWYDASHKLHAYQRLGEIWEERGRNDRAMEYYGRLLALLNDPDPAFRPRAENARRAIERLATERAGP